MLRLVEASSQYSCQRYTKRLVCSCRDQGRISLFCMTEVCCSRSSLFGHVTLCTVSLEERLREADEVFQSTSNTCKHIILLSTPCSYFHYGAISTPWNCTESSLCARETASATMHTAPAYTCRLAASHQHELSHTDRMYLRPNHSHS